MIYCNHMQISTPGLAESNVIIQRLKVSQSKYFSKVQSFIRSNVKRFKIALEKISLNFQNSFACY